MMTVHRLRFVPNLLFTAIFTALIVSPVDAQVSCSVSGPDSIFFDKVQFNRYLPPTFSISVLVTNGANGNADSVVVFPRSNTRFTVIPPGSKLLSSSMKPEDTIATDFAFIVQPRQVSGIDTLVVAVSAKAGLRTECLIPIWVEKEYRPVNEIICPPASSLNIAFMDSVNDYVPNPIVLPLTMINHGDAPSKETRLIFVATPGIAPAEGQLPILDLGVLQPGQQVQSNFALRLVRRSSDTTVDVRFKLQGKGGSGDRIIDTICSVLLTIPASREVEFQLACANDVQLVFNDGRYSPDPFPWSVTIRNTGLGRAKNVRAAVSLPSSVRFDPTSQSEIFVGDLEAGGERRLTWMLRPNVTAVGDTSEICVRVFDEFNRGAECCDSIRIPPIRSPVAHATCVITPDSVFVDRTSGTFLPSEFLTRVTVSNGGSESIDSLWVEIIITDPDIALMNPLQTVVSLSPSLRPQELVSAEWRLAPRPNPSFRSVALLFRIHGRNIPELETTCSVFIDATLLPALNCSVSISPDDTLHFDTGTREYHPLSLTATVRSIGQIAARNVQATILLPSSITLATGENAVKYFSADALPPDSIWQVVWQLVPLKRQEGILDSVRVEFRTGSVRTLCDDWIFIVGIPPLTVLSIPSNVVQRYGQTVRMPVLIDNTDGKDINHLDLSISYDASKVEFLGFAQENTMLYGWLFTSNSFPGMIRFTASHESLRLSGEGTLVYLDFRVTFGLGDDILRISGTGLEFDSLASSINRGSVMTRYLNGGIMVSGDCLWPLRASSNYVILSSKPNPFNPSTVLTLTLTESSHISIEIVNALGISIERLLDRVLQKGTHEIPFKASGLPSGNYYAVMKSGSQTTIHGMVLIR